MQNKINSTGYTRSKGVDVTGWCPGYRGQISKSALQKKTGVECQICGVDPLQESPLLLYVSFHALSSLICSFEVEVWWPLHVDRRYRSSVVKDAKRFLYPIDDFHRQYLLTTNWWLGGDGWSFWREEGRFWFDVMMVSYRRLCFQVIEPSFESASAILLLLYKPSLDLVLSSVIRLEVSWKDDTKGRCHILQMTGLHPQSHRPSGLTFAPFEKRSLHSLCDLPLRK